MSSSRFYFQFHYQANYIINNPQIIVIQYNQTMEQKLNAWSLQEIEDPILDEGGSIIYLKQHKFTICIQQKPQIIQKLPNPEILTVKIILQQEHGIPKIVKVQLTSDSDLYFNFLSICSDWQFKRVREKQNFYIQFRQYPGVILKNLQKLSQGHSKYSAVFTIFSQTEGRMDVIRHSQFRDDNLLSFQFNKSSQQQIRKSIQYRYDQMRQQYISFSQSYQEIAETVKSKNPSLMMQINKALKKK